MNKFTKGFTLIELLVVIAVLGVLAAGVFTAINPVKRINQANDVKIKNDIGQIAQAMQAFYTSSAVVGSVAYYPKEVKDLVPSELKSEPVRPGGSAYNVSGKPTDCTTALKNCTDVAVSAPINEPLTVGNNLWCWKSSTGQANEAAACAP